MSSANPPPNRTANRLRAWAIILTCAAATYLVGAGCTQTGKRTIPSGAHQVESGRGEIRYIAERDGTVWVDDAATDKMVFTGPIRDQERIVVNSDTNQITVNGRTVSEQPLIRDHRYRIYFKRR